MTGWVETPAPDASVCVMAACNHAPAVAIFVRRDNPAQGMPLCEEHVLYVLRRQVGRLMEMREVSR